MNVYVLEFRERLEEELFAHLLRFVNEEKRKRLGRFLRWQDAHRGLFADLLVRQVIIERTGLANEAISFSQNRYGKPFLNNIPGFHFNLSHSGDWVACAVDSMPIGIDVQQIKPIDFAISERYFSAEEHSDLMQKNEADRLSYFFTLWSLKESYIKAKGKGLSIPLKSFTVKAVRPGEIVFKTGQPNEKSKYFMQYDFVRGYKLAVCAQNRKFPTNTAIKELDELIRFFFGL